MCKNSRKNSRTGIVSSHVVHNFWRLHSFLGSYIKERTAMTPFPDEAETKYCVKSSGVFYITPEDFDHIIPGAKLRVPNRAHTTHVQVPLINHVSLNGG